MKHNKYRKISAVFLFSVLILTVWMWKPLNVAAEEPVVSEDTVDLDDDQLEANGDINEENVLPQEDVLAPESDDSLNLDEEENLNIDVVTMGVEEVKPLALDYVGVSELEWVDPGIIRFKVNDSIPGFYVIRIYTAGMGFTDIMYGDIGVQQGSYVTKDLRQFIVPSVLTY